MKFNPGDRVYSKKFRQSGTVLGWFEHEGIKLVQVDPDMPEEIVPRPKNTPPGAVCSAIIITEEKDLDLLGVKTGDDWSDIWEKDAT